MLDVTVFYLCSCISLSLGGYSVCLYAPLCLPASLPDGMLISKNCLPVSVSVLCLCLRIDNIYAYHMSMYRQTVIYLMSVCPSKCACIHTHTHTPHHTHYAVCIHTHTCTHILVCLLDCGVTGACFYCSCSSDFGRPASCPCRTDLLQTGTGQEHVSLSATFPCCPFSVNFAVWVLHTVL